VEGPVFVGAVPLRGQQRRFHRVVADRFDGPFEQEDVRFLTGFEDAKFAGITNSGRLIRPICRLQEERPI
jgi:hypothetical protein